ncbi:MAG: response regulator [Brevibacterium aurantiacum]|uniref:DNA-binding response regulator n=3 Tax=Brevibacterium aurantiacum TaxID=273384 RepID=A0A368M2V7_BREAU|nr:response regulator transcription factor [Brevibacterium aurantiacum]MDN5875528.1 response regulator transcription factor [Brevibacterium sp.]RCS93643.1 DNA-binding response regulator [Brevibacterium aurantiacum]TGD39406.1 DNA-binding response regulator [Brevibacterium aurantiacum]
MIRIVIADDQAMVRAGFAALLDAHPDIEVVGQAQDGAECVSLVAELKPDIVLMDVRMPELDGIEATREILSARSRQPANTAASVNDGKPGFAGQPANAEISKSAVSTSETSGIGDDVPRIIMLTTFDIDDYVFDAIRAGASGFLLKDAPPNELAEAVRVVASGDGLLAPSVTRRVIEHFAAGPQTSNAEALPDLTDREREILVLVARGQTNTEIAATLFIAVQTVKTHVSRILYKLELRDRAQAVIAAYESGLVVPGAKA